MYLKSDLKHSNMTHVTRLQSEMISPGKKKYLSANQNLIPIIDRFDINLSFRSWFGLRLPLIGIIARFPQWLYK